MSNKYLEAYSYLDNGKINYQSFKLIENGNIKKKYSPSGDSKIVNAMEEFNIRPTGSLKYHQAIIKNEMFVDYVDNYLIPKNKKKKKRNKNFKLSKKWWAFITTASVLAIIALNNKSDEVSASENETTITTESTTEEDITPIKEESPLTIEKDIEITTPTDANDEQNIFEKNEIEANFVYNDFEDIFQYSAENKWTDYYDYVEEHYGPYLDKYCPMYGMDKNLAIAILSQENPLNIQNNNAIVDKYLVNDEYVELRSGGYGPAQEENVHNGEIVSCVNLITNETDYINDYIGVDKNGNSMYGVDVKRCETDMDYAIHIFIMTYMDCANYLYQKNNFELTDSQFIDIVTDSYNKGKYGVEKSILYSNSYEDVINLNKNLGGDYYYRSNVYKHLKDGTEISITTNDGVVHKAIFDNTNVDEYLVDSNKEIKAMAH